MGEANRTGGKRVPLGSRDRGSMLIEAGLTLASELSLDAVLQRIVDLATEVIGARYGALGVLGPDGDHIRDFVTTGVTAAERSAIGEPPVGLGLLGLLIREGRPIRVPEIGDDPRSVGFPPNHPPMHSFMGVPVTSRGRVFGNIYLTEKIGADAFDEEDERTLVVLAAQAGVALENARLYEEAQRRERWLDAVREIAVTILSGGGDDIGLDLIAERAMELVGADLAAIAIPAGPGELTIASAAGTNAHLLRGLAFPQTTSPPDEAVPGGRAAIVEDAAADERLRRPLASPGGAGPAMLVPLSSGDRAFGTLAVANLRGGRTFRDDEIGIVETFAAQAAVALEYDRAQQQLQRLAVMEDRERIARELHDGAIQALFAVGMGLEAAASLSGDPDTTRRLADGVTEIDRVIRDLRNYIFGLRPGILADRQLDQALRALAQEFEERSGVLTVVEIDEDLASELGSRSGDLVQMAREALSNVGRHAQATTCRLSLRRRGVDAQLEIDDDGVGIDPSTAGEGGQGLDNLRARAKVAGGEALVESAAGEGTTVRIVLPL